MRWNALFLLLVSLSCFGQEKADSIIAKPEKEYLVGNIWNGVLFNAMDNPAFAGFDRRLQFSYSYQGERLKVPEAYDTRKAGFWNQSAEIDFAFAGKRKNIGVNVSYNGGQELISHYHRVQIAHSYRLHLKDHKLIAGFGLQYLKLKGGVRTATTGDMIDPRYGFIYPGSDFRSLADSIEVLEYSAGFIYNWKGIFVGYSYSREHRSLLTPAEDDFHDLHHISASYSHHFDQMGHVSLGAVINYNSFDWDYEPFLVVTWKESLFASVSAPNVEQFKIHFGLTRWGIRLFYASSFYFNKYAIDNYGVASMEGGIRYHIQPFNRRAR
ncbi:MAG: type IX secretion system membrane protein PorP/SprF [Flavobacteriales bacterium]|nr:type IX secretion system membrane protein PorP/SprF [Flavobacteriales bacterium]MCB9191795.1 type IX secretion system membrane protein PorP/SprF [Flavobacteriales bacterium]